MNRLGAKEPSRFTSTGPLTFAEVSFIMIPMKPTETIAAFDSYLAASGLTLEAVVVGGACLGLLGVVSRQTKDVDILHPKLPESILMASREFAERYTQEVGPLALDWLNNGPADLINDLPKGWQERLELAFSGEAIVLRTLGRLDLLRSKLFALCDRGIDLQDCLALVPAADELAEVLPVCSRFEMPIRPGRSTFGELSPTSVGG